MAAAHNELQRRAMEINGGIPITISSDPRHSFSDNPLAGINAGSFSSWPEPLGMIALRDVERMREYADIVRQEYIGVGLRAALHPQVDLSTMYHWSRIAGGFGEDATLAEELAVAYIEGLQGKKELGGGSVSACVKHFPGGGPQRDGLDCHMPWGMEQDYPGDNMEYHIKPFRSAVQAGVR
jgi:beta-glucosidase